MNLRQSDLSYACIIKELINYSQTIASLKRNCLRSVNLSSSPVDSRTNYEVISCVLTVLFTELNTDIFREKVKVSSQRKSYILTVDVNENESAKNYPSGVTWSESKRLLIKFLMTNFIVDKHPRAKTVD